jgi:hypothetical protein
METLERRYQAQGLTPVRWKPVEVFGCRGCGDTTVGPWTVSIMASVVPERDEALIFVITLCPKCLGNEDHKDEVSETVVTEYLAHRSNKR